MIFFCIDILSKRFFKKNLGQKVFSRHLFEKGNRSETPGKFWNVVLEKDGEDKLDRSCEKWRSVTYSQWAEEYPTWNKKTEG